MAEGSRYGDLDIQYCRIEEFVILHDVERLFVSGKASIKTLNICCYRSHENLINFNYYESENALSESVETMN